MRPTYVQLYSMIIIIIYLFLKKEYRASPIGKIG